MSTRSLPRGARVALWLTLLPLALLTYQNLIAVTGILPGLPLTEAGLAAFVALFALLHSSYVFGWRSTLGMFTITAVVSWSFEQVGASTGLVYGAYHYGEALGPKLGLVPYAIPVAWYSMLYLSYVMALLITDGTSQQAWLRPVSVAKTLWQALVTGLVLTAWDVLIDPLAARALSWTWEHGGAYYGVPNQNFVGWVLTGFTVMVLYRGFDRLLPARPLGVASRPVLALPVLVYGLITVQLMLRRDAPSEWSVLAAFIMGFPVVAAVSQFFKPGAGEPGMPVLA